MEQKIIDREQEIVFTNFTDEAFECTWNGSRLYQFDSGKSYYLPFYLAETFATHLVDRELNKQKLPTNHFSRQQLMDKCVNLQDAAAVTPNTIRRVPMREVRLKSQERLAQDIAKGNIAPSDVPAIGRGASTAPESTFEGV